MAGYSYEVAPSNAPEATESDSAAELVRENAILKAREVFSRYGDCTVIGADTVVAVDGKILGKPSDESDAKRMLRMLSGSTHEVMTGVCVISPEGEMSEVCVTRVAFRDISESEIDAYVATAEPMDKAGAYGIQERASVFVSRIEGDYQNVVGLPISALSVMLLRLGITTDWHNCQKFKE